MRIHVLYAELSGDSYSNLPTAAEFGTALKQLRRTRDAEGALDIVHVDVEGDRPYADDLPPVPRYLMLYAARVEYRHGDQSWLLKVRHREERVGLQPTRLSLDWRRTESEEAA